MLVVPIAEGIGRALLAQSVDCFISRHSTDHQCECGDEATAIDRIAERSGLSVAQVSIELLQLELAGEVAAVPGGYIRVRRA